MPKRGFTLLEILVATIILALTTVGLANIFIVGKRYILSNRSRMVRGELGKYFLDPLQMNVRQDTWGVNGNCLSTTTGCPGQVTDMDNTTYTPTYQITNNSPITNINKVKVSISDDNQPT